MSNNFRSFINTPSTLAKDSGTIRQWEIKINWPKFLKESNECTFVSIFSPRYRRTIFIIFMICTGQWHNITPSDIIFDSMCRRCILAGTSILKFFLLSEANYTGECFTLGRGPLRLRAVLTIHWKEYFAQKLHVICVLSLNIHFTCNTFSPCFGLIGDTFRLRHISHAIVDFFWRSRAAAATVEIESSMWSGLMADI